MQPDTVHAVSTEDTRVRWWLWSPIKFLSIQPAGRQHVFIVLLVALPLWTYAVASASVTLLVDGQVAPYELAKLVAGRVLVFPALFGTYLLAMSIPKKRLPSVMFWLMQFALAFAFLTLMYPVLVVLNSLALGVYTQPNLLEALLHGDLQDAFAPFLTWQNWIQTTLELSEIYLLGLALMLALSSFLRLKAEQLVTTELYSKWLEAQLAALRDQIGPHFLFNALNTILASIRSDPPLAERMTIELGTLLRQNLDRSHQEFTTVGEEVDFVQRYLEIMQARFGDRLKVAIKVEPQLSECKLPSFLFLPLVENAIKHGVSKLPGPNSLEIRGCLTGGCMTFTFSNATLIAAQGVPDDGLDPERKGIGLINIRDRLHKLYGAGGSFKAGYDREGHWIASIVIPVVRIQAGM